MSEKNKEQLPLFALLKLFSLDLPTSPLFTYPYLSYSIDFCQNSEKKMKDNFMQVASCFKPELKEVRTSLQKQYW